MHKFSYKKIEQGYSFSCKEMALEIHFEISSVYKYWFAYIYHNEEKISGNHLNSISMDDLERKIDEMVTKLDPKNSPCFLLNDVKESLIELGREALSGHSRISINSNGDILNSGFGLIKK